MAIRCLFSLSLLLALTGCDSLDQSERSSLTNKDSADSEISLGRLYEASQAEGSANIESGKSSLALVGAHDDSSFEQMPRSPMIADDVASGELGATLFGHYSGIYPCKGCDAIRTSLALKIDGSVTKTNTKIASDRVLSTNKQFGSYYQDGLLIVVTLDNGTTEYYYIDNNRLLWLRGDAKEIKNNPEALSSPDYVLSRN